MIEVKSPIRHNGRLYGEGEKITDITPQQASDLVDSGAADWERIKPGSAAPDPSSADPPDENVGGASDSGDSDPGIDWEAEVKQYHKAFGNYEIPGVGNVKGKEAAIEALKQAQTKG